MQQIGIRPQPSPSRAWSRLGHAPPHAWLVCDQGWTRLPSLSSQPGWDWATLPLQGWIRAGPPSCHPHGAGLAPGQAPFPTMAGFGPDCPLPSAWPDGAPQCLLQASDWNHQPDLACGEMQPCPSSPLDKKVEHYVLEDSRLLQVCGMGT